jgi:hypothetical protein
MKTFRIETKVEVIKTIGYVIEAESEEEARNIILSGSENYEGEEEDEYYYWDGETISEVKLIEDLDN